MPPDKIRIAASLYNDLVDVADGGGCMEIDESEASVIVAMIRAPEYAIKVRQKWEELFSH